VADSVANQRHASEDNEATDKSASSGYKKPHQDYPKRIVAVFGPRLDEYSAPIEIWKEMFAHLIKDEL
jgi:hypothetical protein|tara:strand:- start:1640 stop:1843 length:204 start_codon:yes stop_codon:yes gene_type:complete